MSDTSYESESSICDVMKDATMTCCECISDAATRPWETVKETSAIIWEWIQEYLCFCFTTSSSGRDKRRRKTKRLRSPTSPPQQLLSQKTKTVDNPQPQPKQEPGGTKDAKTSDQKQAQEAVVPALSSTPPNQSPTSQLNRTTSPTLQSEQTIVSSNISQALKSVSKSTAVQPPRPSAPPLEAPAAASSPEQARSSDPPKIGFVETGSIFGDRRRVHDVNTLLLENGRFKSPGQPKIVQGPGGRQIRLSFQTGFPTIKSIESRASMSPYPSRTPSKKSIESPEPIADLKSIGKIASNERQNVKVATVTSNEKPVGIATVLSNERLVGKVLAQNSNIDRPGRKRKARKRLRSKKSVRSGRSTKSFISHDSNNQDINEPNDGQQADGNNNAAEPQADSPESE